MREKRKGRWRAVAVGVATLILAVMTLTWAGPLRSRLDHAAFDAMQSWWPRPPVDVPVRVVDIDEASLARLGQWPWPRQRLAELIERLRAAGAAAVALDLILAEPDRTAPAQVSRDWPLSPAQRAALAKLPDPDSQLATAIGGGWVITGFAADSADQGRDGEAKARFVVSGPPPQPAMPDLGHAVRSLPLFEDQAAGSGAVAVTADGDGVIRRVPLLLRLGERLYPSLALEALRVATGKRNILVKTSPAGALTEVAVGALKIPVDAQGAAHLYYTAPRPERFVPAWQVLDASADPRAIAGHVVFVGTSAKGLQDLRVTPAGDIVPGVVMHAELAEAAQLGALLQRPDWMTGAETLAALVAGLALTAAAAWMTPLAAAMMAATVLAVLAATSGLLFLDARMLADPLPAALAALAAHGATALLRHRQDQAERAFIRGAFARYISPNLVRHLLDHPESLAMGGERRECSFVMTDLAGFTTLVEHSDPTVLLELLNGYIDGMVKIAFRHQGTLDRIVGDAVAVMFSAPVLQPDHAVRALACALEMDAFSRDYVARMRQAGHALGGTRIGVNTGTVTIGNVGGGSIADYRALGDAVNVAARLETVNRQLGTRVCVAASTVRQCPGFSGRPVGELVLKGKEEATLAFEPLPTGSGDAAYLAAYELMAAGDDRAAAAFAVLAAQDPLAAFHRRRLERGETGIRVVLADK